MIKLNILLLVFSSILFACKENSASSSTADIQQNNKKATKNRELSFDTNTIVILPIDTSNPWMFKHSTSFQLTNEDLNRTNNLLDGCVKDHNITQDSTKRFSGYMDLKKYKRQYIPFVNSDGEKKVYINCFYISDIQFKYWKKHLVQVEDGGTCFFQVTINLTNNKYEQLYTNGYG